MQQQTQQKKQIEKIQTIVFAYYDDFFFCDDNLL